MNPQDPSPLPGVAQDLIQRLQDQQSMPGASLTAHEINAANVVNGFQIITQQPASPPRTVLLWTITSRRNPYFTGREDYLATLMDVFHANKGAQVSLALSGLGGIGKTQIALEYAYRSANDYQFVLWARAATRDTLIDSFTSFATSLSLPEKEERNQPQVVQAVKRWLTEHSNWLLILDNADVELAGDFLPVSPTGHILLTTRAEVTPKLAQRIEVKTFPPDIAECFLFKRKGLLTHGQALDQASDNDRTLARRICQKLDGHPLALDQAGAYMLEEGISLATYLKRYAAEPAQILDRRGGDLIEDHPESATKTMLLPFALVQQRNVVAADILRFCAFLAPDAIPEELISKYLIQRDSSLPGITRSAQQLDGALKVLRAYSLISQAPNKRTLSIHQVVQDILQDTLEVQERRVWAARTLHTINAIFPHTEHDNWSLCEQLLPHAMEVSRLSKKYKFANEETGHLLHEMAFYLRARTRYEEAVPLYKRALDIRELLLGSNHLDVASTLHELSKVYSELGQYKKARQWCERSLHIFEQQLGVTHPNTASSLNNLAILSKVQGRPDEAEELYIRCLDIQVQSLAPDYFDMASLLRFLSTPSKVQGEPDKKMKLQLRRLLHNKTAVCKFALVLNNLAVLYAEQAGKYEAARRIFQFGAEQQPDRFEMAERLFQLCLWLQERCQKPDNPDFALSLNNLANLYTEWGSKHVEKQSNIQCLLFEMANKCYRHSLKILQIRKGAEHPDVAYPLNGLGILYFERGKREEMQSSVKKEYYKEAESFYLESRGIWEKRLGDTHPQFAYALYNLANLYTEQEKYEEAEPLYQRSLNIWDKSMGADHPHTRAARARHCFSFEQMSLWKGREQYE